ncbi:TIGR02452 family protein [Chloroflexia bacterium SDU3-3]|nr:TIGR02452 family protein [Chloroflexia bacterium SDU3-3]
MYPSRDRAATLGREAAEILRQGGYRSPGGADVELRPLIERARAATESYPAERALPAAQPGDHPTSIRVVNESTLAAAQGLVASGRRCAVLNFASARNPGGGWLGGARAQEESLARASALVPCIEGDPMYERHRHMSDALYTSSLIYSPDVPVFRDAAGLLLDTPYLVDFITAPAVNAGVVLDRAPQRGPEIAAAMRERVGRVLAVAAAHGCPALVLGAWGCGVFRNDPAAVANMFAQALAGPFRGAFAQVVFAVLDSSAERRFIGPFERAFGGQR